MKLILVMTILSSAAFSYAQPDSLLKEFRKYNATVKTNAGTVHKGMIVTLSEDSIIIGPSWKTFKPADIKTIRFRRKGAPGRAMLFGGTIGIVSGALGGLIAGDDPKDQLWFHTTAGEKAVISALTLLPIGVGAGALISATTVKVHKINGEQENFIRAINSLKNDIQKKKRRAAEY